MEVVSPLTLTAGDPSTKRRFASPIQTHENDDAMMMDQNDPCFPSVKRRRKNDHDSGGGAGIVGAWMSPFGMAAGGGFAKRSRSRSPPASQSNKLTEQLQSTISTQALELSTLKSQHAAALSSHSQLESTNAQLINENKILKKAVGIQQERQSHLNSELENARRVNEEMGERIRRLEQMNLMLRYQLEAAGVGRPQNGHDFMGGFGGNRPPDVY